MTNGYFVPDKVEELKACDMVLVSLDGVKETNDLLRGKGSYGKAVKAMETLEKNKIQFRIDTVVSSGNMNDKDIMHVINLAKKFRTDANLIQCILTSITKILK